MAPKLDKEVEKQIKLIWKELSRLNDIEKRLKFVEERGKVLADSLTSEKDLEKLMDVHIKKLERDQQDSMKATERRMEIQQKIYEAQEKKWDKENEKYRKESEKMLKEVEKQQLDVRLKVLEARIAKLGG
ncbi:hypothetical protein AB2B41_18860 [Marimonas sp. MJW-29]|uniref:Uncharacterized protein n=1 Tax=Sulfitobacter sediminis TaxID=3234186 RepID=A0ABV3RS03_9RHOB